MHNPYDKNDLNDLPHTDEEIDEYELYYGEHAVIEPHEHKPKIPGPLSRRPVFQLGTAFFFHGVTVSYFHLHA